MHTPNEKDSENVHKNHRLRVKAKFIEHGLDTFAEHEVLELLLYYAIPQADTNPIAHRLLSHYGKLYNVLDASYDSLIENKDIGEHAATLLKLIPAVLQYYARQKAEIKAGLTSNIIAYNYVSRLFASLDHEEFYIICLDAQNNVFHTKRISTGDYNKVEVPIRQVTDYILKHQATRILLAHNHPKASAEPSDEDLVLTHKLFHSCVLNDIDILDHIIYSPTGCYSMAQSGVLRQIKSDVIHILRYDVNQLKARMFSTTYAGYELVDDTEYNATMQHTKWYEHLCDPIPPELAQDFSPIKIKPVTAKAKAASIDNKDKLQKTYAKSSEVPVSASEQTALLPQAKPAGTAQKPQSTVENNAKLPTTKKANGNAKRKSVEQKPSKLSHHKKLNNGIPWE